MRKVIYGGRERSKLGGKNNGQHIFDVVREEGNWIWVDEFGYERLMNKTFVDDTGWNGVNWFKGDENES